MPGADSAKALWNNDLTECFLEHSGPVGSAGDSGWIRISTACKRYLKLEGTLLNRGRGRDPPWAGQARTAGGSPRATGIGPARARPSSPAPRRGDGDRPVHAVTTGMTHNSLAIHAVFLAHGPGCPHNAGVRDDGMVDPHNGTCGNRTGIVPLRTPRPGPAPASTDFSGLTAP